MKAKILAQLGKRFLYVVDVCRIVNTGTLLQERSGRSILRARRLSENRAEVQVCIAMFGWIAVQTN